MENFYVFLDIDGVMYDWKWILSQSKKGGRLDRFKPESVFALNYLLDILSHDFKTQLVISSTWRHDMIDTRDTLINNGVKLDNVSLSATPISNTPLFRGREILDYLNGDIDCNYIIIDDELCDIPKYFSVSRVIKTNMQDSALNIDMVKCCLEKNNISYNSFFDKEK